MHFDYCTTATIDFVLLDEQTFTNILQVGAYFQDKLVFVKGLVLPYQLILSLKTTMLVQ